MSDTLPRDLVWDDAGHLGEVAITALADGQEQVVPADAREHAAACESCARRLGAEAMLSADVGRALTQPRRVPWAAVAVAFGLAAAGSAPVLVSARAWLVDLRFTAGLAFPILVRTLGALLRELASGTWGLALAALTTATLLAVGFTIARSATRGAQAQKGVI